MKLNLNNIYFMHDLTDNSKVRMSGADIRELCIAKVTEDLKIANSNSVECEMNAGWKETHNERIKLIFHSTESPDMEVVDEVLEVDGLWKVVYN